MTLSESARQVLATLWQWTGRLAETQNTAGKALPADGATPLELEREGLVPGDLCDAALAEDGWSEVAYTVRCRPLAELMPGDEGHIACIQSHEQRAFHKLIAMGILPGNPITLLRRSPAYVFQVGFSQFAVDRDIAEKIHVRRCLQPDPHQN